MKITLDKLVEYLKDGNYDEGQFSERWIRQMADGKDLDYLYAKAAEFCGTITDEDWAKWCNGTAAKA